MKRLEDFVVENSDDFNDEMPSPDMWERIEARLESETLPQSKQISENTHKHRFLKVAMSIAAVMLVALVTTFFVVINNANRNPMDNYSLADAEIRELIETENYYSAEVMGKMNEIEKCYNIYPELKADIEADMQELESMYSELRKDLKDNLYSREVIEAMIQNNRLRLELVDRVLGQINC